MSTQRGNVSKSKPPKHQNSFAYKHNKNSKKTEKILSSPNEGLCAKCTEKIEWKKKYRKYKPLTTIRKCANCDQKKIKRAYHKLCKDCATALKVCANCRQAQPISEIRDTADEIAEQRKLREALRTMSERERRALYRSAEKGDSDEEDDKDAKDYDEDDDRDENDKDSDEDDDKDDGNDDKNEKVGKDDGDKDEKNEGNESDEQSEEEGLEDSEVKESKETEEGSDNPFADE